MSTIDPPRHHPIDPFLLDIPQQMETERLLLCAPQANLSVIINPAIQESLENLKKWFKWAHEPQTLQRTEMNIRKAMGRFHNREELRYYLFKKEDGIFVGTASIFPVSWEVPSFELGYWVSTPSQRQGFITEAVRGLTHFAFTTCQAQRVEIHCNVRNQRSAMVAERAGFIFEGTRHWDSRDVDGKLCDTLVFVKFKTSSQPSPEPSKKSWRSPLPTRE